MNADWVRLWRLAQRVEAAGEHLIDIGLGVVDPAGPPRDGGYRTSPVNATMLARTGGDGVHFSLLPTGPVVMTVPMAFDAPNHVVGGDLVEFLALGCQVGYYRLDALAYSWGRPGIITTLRDARLAPGDDGAVLLGALIDEFGLRPWPDPGARLAELDARHLGDLRLADRDG